MIRPMTENAMPLSRFKVLDRCREWVDVIAGLRARGVA
jgi:hypothetical protein